MRLPAAFEAGLTQDFTDSAEQAASALRAARIRGGEPPEETVAGPPPGPSTGGEQTGSGVGVQAGQARPARRVLVLTGQRQLAGDRPGARGATCLPAYPPGCRGLARSGRCLPVCGGGGSEAEGGAGGWGWGGGPPAAPPARLPAPHPGGRLHDSCSDPQVRPKDCQGRVLARAGLPMVPDGSDAGGDPVVGAPRHVRAVHPAGWLGRAGRGCPLLGASGAHRPTGSQAFPLARLMETRTVRL
jgi:hypothetical protein